MKETFPPNYSLLLSGPPGVGKFEYLLDLAKYYVDRGEGVVFVTLEVHPREIRNRMLQLGCDVDAVEGERFCFVDCYSAAASDRGEVASGKKIYTVSSFSNLEGLGMAIAKAGNDIGTPVRILFYTISTLFLHNSAQAIAKFYQIITSRVKTNMGFVCYALHDGVHEPMTVNLLRSLVDGVLEMRFNEDMEREIRVHHMRGIPVRSTWTPFVVEGHPFEPEGGKGGTP
jgi:KaiC/GvpD/RAD55 family RecA-like ATPase